MKNGAVLVIWFLSYQTQQARFPSVQNAFIETVKTINIPRLNALKQYRVNDEATLYKQLKQMAAQGGVGLMLYRADAEYITERSDVLLKVKLLLDAESTVIACMPGFGKYTGNLGSLEVETPEGIHFNLGTGFTDAQSADPPKIGSTVTYSYRDKTKTDKPKFASFLRVRNEQ
jgi:DNA ligase-1